MYDVNDGSWFIVHSNSQDRFIGRCSGGISLDGSRLAKSEVHCHNVARITLDPAFEILKNIGMTETGSIAISLLVIPYDKTLRGFPLLVSVNSIAALNEMDKNDVAVYQGLVDGAVKFQQKAAQQASAARSGIELASSIPQNIPPILRPGGR